jgi:hypothetical protein
MPILISYYNIIFVQSRGVAFFLEPEKEANRGNTTMKSDEADVDRQL